MVNFELGKEIAKNAFVLSRAAWDKEKNPDSSWGLRIHSLLQLVTRRKNILLNFVTKPKIDHPSNSIHKHDAIDTIDPCSK